MEERKRGEEGEERWWSNSWCQKIPKPDAVRPSVRPFLSRPLSRTERAGAGAQAPGGGLESGHV